MERFTSRPVVLFLSTIVVFSNVPLDLAITSTQSNNQSINTIPSKLKKNSTSKVKPPRKPRKPQKTTTSPQPLQPDKDEDDVRFGCDQVLFNQSLFIEKLLDSRASYILVTRPRCLGKTTFLQLLDNFFRGKRHLFEGTTLFDRGNTDYNNGSWLEYPVIYLDFGKIGNAPTRKIFQNQLHNIVQLAANSYGTGGSDCSDLASLIDRLQLKYNLPVVIFVDEYDRSLMEILVRKPGSQPTGWLKRISSRISSILAQDTDKLAAEMKRELETFFRVIASVDGRHIKLAFVTGVSRLRINGMDENGPFVDMTDEYSTMVLV